jgi:hypothetical protein
MKIEIESVPDAIWYTLYQELTVNSRDITVVQNSENQYTVDWKRQPNVESEKLKSIASSFTFQRPNGSLFELELEECDSDKLVFTIKLPDSIQL